MLVVADLKHDLGKGVAWRSANLDDSLWIGPLGDDVVDALRADILETRRCAEGRVESAWEVWRRLSGSLPRPLPAELARVDESVAFLETAEQALRVRDRDTLTRMCDRIRAAQGCIREELAAIARRLRSEAKRA